MKPSTARMLVEVLRNVKGIITCLDRWVREEGHIGTLSVSPRGGNAAPENTVTTADSQPSR